MNFGTTEESQTVRVCDLEPGVRVDGVNFGQPNTLVVQEVKKSGASGLMYVDAANFESGRHIERWLSWDRPVQTWGKI
jgi:hypothetical protein